MFPVLTSCCLLVWKAYQLFIFKESYPTLFPLVRLRNRTPQIEKNVQVLVMILPLQDTIINFIYGIEYFCNSIFCDKAVSKLCLFANDVYVSFHMLREITILWYRHVLLCRLQQGIGRRPAVLNLVSNTAVQYFRTELPRINMIIQIKQRYFSFGTTFGL